LGSRAEGGFPLQLSCCSWGLVGGCWALAQDATCQGLLDGGAGKGVIKN